MKKFIVFLSVLLFLGCGIKTSDVFETAVVPDNCKDAYVYKLKLYPTVTAAIEVAAITVLASVENSADPMILVSQKALEEIKLGSAKVALAELVVLFTKNSKYAPAAIFAVSQVQDKLKDVVLTQCDKDVLSTMFTRILGYAQSAKMAKK